MDRIFPWVISGYVTGIKQYTAWVKVSIFNAVSGGVIAFGITVGVLEAFKVVS